MASARGIRIDISLLGDKSLTRTFKRLPAAVQKKVLRKGLRAGAKHLLVRARALASAISERLARGLKVRALKSKRRDIIGVAVYTPRKRDLDIPEDASGYWPAHVELGFTHVGGKQMPGRPYLRQAADEKRESAFREVARAMNEAISKEWRKK